MARTWSSLFLSTYKIIENNKFPRGRVQNIFLHFRGGCNRGATAVVRDAVSGGCKGSQFRAGKPFWCALSDRVCDPLQYSKHCKALCSFEVLCSVSQVLCVYGNLPCNFPARGDRLPSIMLGSSVRLCRYRLLRPGFGICCFGFCIPARWISSFARWPGR